MKTYVFLFSFIFLVSIFSFEIKYYPETDDVGLSGSDYELDYLFSIESKNENLLIDRISGFRNVDEISSRDLSILRAAWDRSGDAKNWNYDFIDNLHIRILIAEVLHRYDHQGVGDFKKFIINNIYSDVQSYRAYAALSIGFIGDEIDIDLLINVLLGDDFFPASQAGFGLLAMRNDLASRRLHESLSVLCERSDYKSVRLCMTLRKYIDN